MNLLIEIYLAILYQELSSCFHLMVQCFGNKMGVALQRGAKDKLSSLPIFSKSILLFGKAFLFIHPLPKPFNPLKELVSSLP